MDASSTDKQILEISPMSRNLCPVTSGHDLYSSVLPAKGHSRARRSQHSQSTNNIDLRALVIAICEILRFRFTAFVCN